VVTFQHEHFRRFHLNPYFPSVSRVDLARFPEPAGIADLLSAHGLEDVRVQPIHQRIELEPARLVERVRGRYISTLHLIPEDEYRAGLHRLERDMAERLEPVAGDLMWAMVTARRPGRP
jgi:hypothetical protein